MKNRRTYTAKSPLIWCILAMLSLASCESNQKKNVWELIGEFGGAVRGIAIHPNGDVFVGIDDQGVYRSTDRGDHWLPTSLTVAVKSLTIRSDGTIFVGGTSDLYQSTDLGDHWTAAGYPLPYVWNLLPLDDDMLMAATYDGVYRSTDDGIHWTNMGLSDVRCLARHPNGSIFAGTLSAIFVSTNGGVSWIPNFGLGSTVWSLYSDSSGHMFLAGGFKGLYHSIDSGSTWNKVDTPFINTYVTVLTGDLGRTILVSKEFSGVFMSNDQGDHWIQLFGLEDPLVTALAMKSGSLFAGSFDGELFRTVPEP